MCVCTSCVSGNSAPLQQPHILNITNVHQPFLQHTVFIEYADWKAAIAQARFRQTLACQCPSALHLYISDPVCRRYTLPLEEFYVNTPNGPNITAYQNGEPKSHKTFNCSIHCGGQQFCGAGNPGQSGRRTSHGLPCIDRPPWPFHNIVVLTGNCPTAEWRCAPAGSGTAGTDTIVAY